MEPKPLTFQELSALRKKTEAISQYLTERLSFYLDVLRPLLSPEKVLGKYGGYSDYPGMDKSLAQIQENYKQFAAKPFDLPRDFETDWLQTVGNRIELHRFEYLHEAGAAGQGKTIRMTSPVRWIMTYASGLSPFQVTQTLAAAPARREQNFRQFVVNALVLQLTLAKIPGLVGLFSDLRFTMQTETLQQMGRLPVLTITSCLASFRPADDLVLAATDFSGVPAFIELIDIDTLADLKDPLREKIQSLAG